MKQSIQFDHEAKTFAKAIGVPLTQHELATKLADIAAKFVSEKYSKVSMLAEMLHNELSYESILFLATNEVHSRIAEVDEIAANSILSSLDRIIDAIKGKETKEEDGINLN